MHVAEKHNISCIMCVERINRSGLGVNNHLIGNSQNAEAVAIPWPMITSAEIAASDQIIDVRLPLNYAKNHLHRAINIPLSPNFINWVKLFITIEKPFILVGSSEDQILKSMQRLSSIGCDHVKGCLLLPNDPSDRSLEHLSVLDVYALYAHILDMEVIDVRSEEEWKSGHIAQAKHVPLTNLLKQLDTIPKEQPLAIICASGARSSTAASILTLHGFKEVSNVEGGMQAWKEAVLPIAISPHLPP